VLLRVHSDLLSMLCDGAVGIGAVRTADVLGSEVSGADCGECYVIAVL
jgi:hypothetical protein